MNTQWISMNLNNQYYGFFSMLTKIDNQTYLQVRAPDGRNGFTGGSPTTPSSETLVNALACLLLCIDVMSLQHTPQAMWDISLQGHSALLTLLASKTMMSKAMEMGLMVL